MTFQWPLLLTGLALVPVLVAAYVFAQRRRRRYAIRFTNLALLREVAGPGPGLRRHIPPLLYLVGLSALLISLARPMAVIAVPREQTAAMLVLDVSGSMTARDLEPSRMEAAKQAAQAFVQALPDSMQVGLVTFSTNAMVRSAPTEDHEAVLAQIARLRPEGGTAIGEGLALALDQIAMLPTGENGQRPPALVVLLSDGESQFGQSPEAAAARAEAEQVKVHTVGVGQRGASVRIGGGQRVGLNEETLQAIAQQTDGEYFYAAESGELEQIYEGLGSEVSWVEERTEVTFLVSAAGTLFLILGGLLGLRWFQQFP
jgi:Ca-activated chloride channel family protein